MNKWLLAGLLQFLSFGCDDDGPIEENQPCVMRDAGGPDATVFIDPPYGCTDHPDDLIGR